MSKLAIVCAAIFAVSCTISPGGGTTHNQAKPATARSVTPVRSDLPPPPGVTAQVFQPHASDVLIQAQRSLDDILADLPVPEAKSNAPSTIARDEHPPVKAVQTYAIARAAYEAGQLERARQLLLQVVQIDPQSLEAFRLLGQVSVELSSHARAGIYLDQALMLAPGDPATLCQFGRLAFVQGRWLDAIAGIGHWQRLDETSVEPGVAHLVRYQLGMALIRAGFDDAGIQQLQAFLVQRRQYDRSSRYLRHMAALVQREPAVHVQIGDALVRLKRYVEAEHHYRLASESTYILPKAILPRLIYTDLVFGDDAAAVQRLLELNWASAPDDAAPLARYVIDHVSDPKRAIASFQTAAAQEPVRPTLMLVVASLLDESLVESYLADQLKRAPHEKTLLAEWLKLALQSDVAVAVQKIALLVERYPDHARQLAIGLVTAVEDVKTLLPHVSVGESPSASNTYLRGMMLQAAGNAEAARLAYMASVQADPNFIAPRLAVIDLKLRLGQNEQALQMIDESDISQSMRLQQLRVQALAGLDRLEEALVVADKLAMEKPRNIQLLMQRVRLLEKLKRFADVELSAEGILKIDPTYEPAYTILFRLHRRGAPDARKFLQTLRRLQQVKPNARLTRQQTAYLHMIRNELDRAVVILRQLHNEQPGDFSVLSDLVRALGRSNQWKAAQQLLVQRLDAIGVNQTITPATLELLRQVTSRTNDRAVFYRYYERLLKNQPPSKQVWLRLSSLYLDQNRLDDAIDAQRKAMALDKAQAEPDQFLRLAELLRMAKRYDEALTQVSLAIAAQPRDARLYVVKARILHDNGQSEDAVQLLRDALSRSLDDTLQLHVELAEMYMAIDQLTSAVEQIDLAIAAHPIRAAPLHYRKSHFFVRAGRTAKAEDALKAALAIDPNFSSANNDLGYMWADRGVNLDEARKLVRKALAADPDSAAVRDSMGWVYYKMGEFKQAVAMLRKATELPRGDDPVLYDHLGDALWRMGEKSEAITSWKKSFELLESSAEGGMQRDNLKLKRSLDAKLRAVEKGEMPQTAEVPTKPIEPAPAE